MVDALADTVPSDDGLGPLGRAVLESVALVEDQHLGTQSLQVVTALGRDLVGHDQGGTRAKRFFSCTHDLCGHPGVRFELFFPHREGYRRSDN